MHRYGYYECRCRLQQMPGWWSAFWMWYNCTDNENDGCIFEVFQTTENKVDSPVKVDMSFAHAWHSFDIL